MLWKSRGIYRLNWAPEYRYEAARQILARGSTPEPWKRDPGHVFTYVLGRRAQRRLLRAAHLSPCQLHVSVSDFGPLF